MTTGQSQREAPFWSDIICLCLAQWGLCHLVKDYHILVNSLSLVLWMQLFYPLLLYVFCAWWQNIITLQIHIIFTLARVTRSACWISSHGTEWCGLWTEFLWERTTNEMFATGGWVVERAEILLWPAGFLHGRDVWLVNKMLNEGKLNAGKKEHGLIKPAFGSEVLGASLISNPGFQYSCTVY